MDVVRLGLERGRTARETLEVMAGLIERHGQGGPALAPGATGYHNSFLIADAFEAWLFETSNRHWAARRTTLEGVSNHFGIGTDWEIGSRGLESFARDQGWWMAPEDTERLDVAAAFRNRHIPPRLSEGRQRRSRELLWADRGQHDLGTFRRLLRDHGDDTTAWDPRGATTDHERYFTRCAHSEPVQTTTASLVAALPMEREAPWPVLIGFGTPCTGMMIPVYLAGVIPPELARGGEEPEDDSMFWAFARLQDAAEKCSARGKEVRLRDRWLDLERAIEAEQLEVEARARTAARSGEIDDATAHVSDFMARCVERVFERIEVLCAELS
jgi:secernin